MSSIVTLIVVAVAVLLGIALAYVPMRLLLGQIAKNVTQFIQRRRDRRRISRGTPDRRTKEEEAAAESAAESAAEPR